MDFTVNQRNPRRPTGNLRNWLHLDVNTIRDYKLLVMTRESGVLDKAHQ